jgi:SAM-dependent methyltransferase
MVFNEADHLSDFVAWYRLRLSDVTFYVYDNGSTDGTQDLAQALGCLTSRVDTGGEHDMTAMLAVKNHAWKEGSSDWVLVCDADEFLQIDDEFLARTECDIVQAEGFDMIGQGEPISEIRIGVRDPILDKFLCFRRATVREIRYDPGCHFASPESRHGAPLLSIDTRPMYHFRWLSCERVIARNELINVRRGATSRLNGWGVHYEESPESTRQRFEELRSRAWLVPSLLGDGYGTETFLYHGPMALSGLTDARFVGVGPDGSDARDIVSDPFGKLPLEDASMASVLSEDVFHYADRRLVPYVLNELHRVVRPGGMLRLAVPDYRSPYLRGRCLFGDAGQLLADAAFGVEVQMVDGAVGPQVSRLDGRAQPSWFPDYEKVLEAILKSDWRGCAEIEFKQFWMSDGTNECRPLDDHPELPVRRTPPNDLRAGGQPLSLVVDLRR